MSQWETISTAPQKKTAERSSQAKDSLRSDHALKPKNKPSAASEGLWDRQVAAWNLLGAPLRPTAEDIAQYARSVQQWSHQHGPPRGLILGVTPELAGLDWPEGADVVAVDRSQVMLQQVWPGFPERGRGGICGDWSDLPLAECSRDLALGDGPFTQLAYPEDYRRVLGSLHRALSKNGVATIRFFIKPDETESPEQVLTDLHAGRIGNFHALKWRLAMALQANVRHGIQLGTIWNYWAKAVNAEEIAQRFNWSPQVIATIDNYRGLTSRYSFPTLTELRRVLSPEFVETHCHVPQYELGERCPILTLRTARFTPPPQRNGRSSGSDHA